MPRRTGERQGVRSFSFRLPQDVFNDLETLAKWRGVDVSSLLNWILAERRPHLLKLKAEHEAAMLEAAASRVWAKQPSTAEALRTLRELLGKLQDEYAEMMKRSLDEDQRRAS
jgi:predicted DNA-binding ribbon-helix-helix protein